MYHRQMLLALVVLVLTAPLVRAVEQKDVDAAIVRGVAALKRMQGGDGSWPYPQSGATSLAGLTLLECDVKPDEKCIQVAAENVRKASPTTTQTYSVALAIIFLDRLGDPGDIPLLESLMIRLMAGQYSDGGWGYECPAIAEAEITRLKTYLRNRTELKGGRDLSKPGKRTVSDMPREIQQQLAVVLRRDRPEPIPRDQNLPSGTDNSNTQFATLAMWVGRRHGFPVENGLGRLELRYRLGQNADGSWGYNMPRPLEPSTGSAAMTCAGALGIAVAHGAAHDPEARRARPPLDPTKDLALQRALLALGTTIGDPVGRAAPIAAIGAQNGKSYYFLWSLERLAVALNLETIGKKDWYNWGAEVLLANQQADGSWRGEYGGFGADTCFALLFLRRSNLVSDLSANLKGKLKDPATVVLRSGGVGGAGLPGVGKTLKSGLAPEGKPGVDSRPKDAPRMKPLPARVENTEADDLSTRLLEAKGVAQEKVLKELRDSKGRDYTEALAIAIPRLQGEGRDKARDALAERLARMSARQLTEYLKDGDPEIRRGTVNAFYMKDVRDHIPLIIDRLSDPDAGVARTAHAVLKQMTKQDFGPELGSTREEHEKAVQDWKKWWDKESKR